MKWFAHDSAALLLVALLVCGQAAGQQSDLSTDPEVEAVGGPRLEISTRDWDFGTVWQGVPLELQITLKNVGDAPLVFEDTKTSCGCALSTRPKSPLSPGESCEIKISYASKTKMGKAHQTITLVTNDPLQRLVPITIRGEVKPCYEVDPKNGLIFGTLLRTARETRAMSILNRYEKPLSLRLEKNQEAGPFEFELKQVEPGQRYELSATSLPPIASGTYNGRVVLSTSLEHMPEITIPVFARVAPPIEVRGKLRWPRSSVMDMKQRIWLVHPSDQPVEVREVKASHEMIKVEYRVAGESSTAVAPLGQYEIWVTLPPGDLIPPGDPPAIEILTTSDDPEYRKLTVPIQIVG